MPPFLFWASRRADKGTNIGNDVRCGEETIKTIKLGRAQDKQQGLDKVDERAVSEEVCVGREAG